MSRGQGFVGKKARVVMLTQGMAIWGTVTPSCLAKLLLCEDLLFEFHQTVAVMDDDSVTRANALLTTHGLDPISFDLGWVSEYVQARGMAPEGALICTVKGEAYATLAA